MPITPCPSSTAALLSDLHSLVPVVTVLIFLPLRLSTLHLAIPTSTLFFWLANSKLLLLVFHRAPLVDSPNLLNFLVVDTPPVKLSSSSIKLDPPCFFRRFLLVLKVLLLGCMIQSYDYRLSLHPIAIYKLLCVHLYLELEIVRELYAVPAMVLLRRKFEPQFDEPYLATSLNDFWGRQWNLTVTEILRSTVYDPIQQALAGSTVFGKEAIRVVATLATFTVSGVMHEELYIYMTRLSPAWDVTWFFILHGFCVVVEVALKRRVLRQVKADPGVVRLSWLGMAWWECSFGLNFFKEIAF